GLAAANAWNFMAPRINNAGANVNPPRCHPPLRLTSSRPGPPESWNVDIRWRIPAFPRSAILLLPAPHLRASFPRCFRRRPPVSVVEELANDSWPRGHFRERAYALRLIVDFAEHRQRSRVHFEMASLAGQRASRAVNHIPFTWSQGDSNP